MSTEDFRKKRKHITSDVTRHFCLYVLHLKRAFDNVNRHMDKKLAQAWIVKLMEDPYPTYFKAMRRNIYLVQLLINLYDGKLQTPFTKMPTNKPLDIFGEFSFNRKPNKRMVDNITYKEPLNKELPLDEFNYISSNERTYIAIQSLTNGTTLIGYVAVTVGHNGADPLWINSQGETIKNPTPNFQDIPISSSVSQEIRFDIDDYTNNGLNSSVNEVWNVLSQRHTLKIQEQTNDFYRMLHNVIEQEMLMEQNNLLTSNCRDPYVNKLIDFLTEDLTAEVIRDNRDFHRLSLLSELKGRIRTIINKIKTRQKVLENAKKETTTPTMQLCLHPLTNCLKSIPRIVLQEALGRTINTKKLDLLFMHYPASLINIFKKEIVNEKVRMMRSAKIRLDNVTREMYKDLRETINQGLRNYRAARVEWIRACSVIEEYNEVSKFVATTRNSESSKEKFLKIIQNEIDAAEKRLNNTRINTEKVKNEIDLLRVKINKLQEKHKAEIVFTEEQRNLLNERIANEEMEIQQRINVIKHLESIAVDEGVVSNNNR